MKIDYSGLTKEDLIKMLHGLEGEIVNLVCICSPEKLATLNPVSQELIYLAMQCVAFRVGIPE